MEYGPLKMRARLFVASICGVLLVIAGAYLGHGPAIGFPISAESYLASRMDVLEFKETLNSALMFGFVHIFAAMLVGVLPIRSRLVLPASWSFLTGVVLFSGVLCLRSLEQFQNQSGIDAFTDRIVLLVPLGGLAFITGWTFLGLAVLRSVASVRLETDQPNADR